VLRAGSASVICGGRSVGSARAGPGLPRQRPGAGARPRRAQRAALILINGSIRQRSAPTGHPCPSGFWRCQPEGLDKGPAKSQVGQIGALTCDFLVAANRKPGHRDLRRCCGCQARAPRVSLPSPEGCLKRAKQRANGARLPATPSDSRRRSPLINDLSGDFQPRRNTQKSGLHPGILARRSLGGRGCFGRARDLG
jgi:hypothetical protein